MNIIKRRNKVVFFILFFIVVLININPSFAYTNGNPGKFYSDSGYIANYRDDNNSNISNADKNLNTAIKNFVDEYRELLVVLMAFGILTSLLAFIVNFVRLGAVAERPLLRKKIVANLLTDGILLALLGGFTLVLTIFYSIILD